MNDDRFRTAHAQIPQRVRAIIRDWQLAHRIGLTKEAATDLADRFSLALNDATTTGMLERDRQISAAKEQP